MLRYQPKSSYLAAVFAAAAHKIYPGSLHAGVPEYISQLHDVPVGAVICHSEQMPQIVGENLPGGNAATPGKPLHAAPYLLTAQTFASPSEKYLTGEDIFCPAIAKQLTA